MNKDVMTCISCGMPMQTLEEHAMKDATKNYCCYCARPDGAMKSYDEALTGMSGFLKKTQGLDDAAARETAKGMMAKNPAWRGHK